MSNGEKSSFPTISVAIFSITYVVLHMIEISPMIVNFLTAVTGLFCLFVLFIKNVCLCSSFIALGTMASFLMLLSMLYNGNSNVANLLWIWAYLGVAATLFYCEIKSEFFEYFFWFVLLLFVYKMLSGVAVGDALAFGSENNISAQLVFFLGIFLITKSKSKNFFSIPYMPIIISIAVTAWSGSRAGLLSLVTMLVFSIFYNTFFARTSNFRNVVYILIAVVLGYIVILKLAGDYFAIFFMKMERYGGASIRSVIWTEYVEGAFSNIFNLLFGIETHNTTYTYMNLFGGNPHNSFLTLHARFGIVGFVGIVYAIVSSTINFIRDKELILLGVMAMAYVRMFFDWVAFPGVYDVFFWYVILYLLDKRHKKLLNVRKVPF